MTNRFLDKGKCNIVLDGQWGSTGKGKLAAYLGDREELAAVTADFNSNAGHTFVLEDDTSHVLHHLPCSVVNLDAMVIIGASAGITVEKLLQEIDELDKYGVADRLAIHPMAGIITEDDALAERSELKGTGFIGSTQKGVGAALVRKVMRRAPTAKDIPELKPFIQDTTAYLASTLRGGGTVLAETAQGFDLSLNHGHSYPYVTSRDVTTASALNNLGLPPHCLGRVWGSLRAFPIRVGHIYDDAGVKTGDSGPYYRDQVEYEWDELSDLMGQTLRPELTTVTKRQRRIFSWSWMQYEKFLRVCAPTDLFVNFVNYIHKSNYAVRSQSLLSSSAKSFVTEIHGCGIDAWGRPPKVSLLGTGPKMEDMVEIA